MSLSRFWFSVLTCTEGRTSRRGSVSCFGPCHSRSMLPHRQRRAIRACRSNNKTGNKTGNNRGAETYADLRRVRMATQVALRPAKSSDPCVTAGTLSRQVDYSRRGSFCCGRGPLPPPFLHKNIISGHLPLTTTQGYHSTRVSSTWATLILAPSSPLPPPSFS